jgi:hypothetical protein
MSNPPSHNYRMKLKNQFMLAVEIQALNDHSVSPQVVLYGPQLTSKDEKLPIKVEQPMKEALSMKASLHIKAAEYWFKLGEADQALKELEALPSRYWNHRWALKTRIAAMRALRERDEMTVQA